MPMFEYRCTECGHVEEHLMSMSDNIDKIECWDCGADSKKQISRSSFTLTGGGWYASGYSKK